MVGGRGGQYLTLPLPPTLCCCSASSFIIHIILEARSEVTGARLRADESRERRSVAEELLLFNK